jgi:hypothetical protein
VSEEVICGFKAGGRRRSGFLADIIRRNRDIFAAPRGAYYIVPLNDRWHIQRAVDDMGRGDLTVIYLPDVIREVRQGAKAKVVLDFELYQMLDESDWREVYRLLAMAEKV